MDPDFQYRTTPNITPAATQVYSQDDADNGTLKAVHTDLKTFMDGLNKWDAFNIAKDSPLTVEQQIEVNRGIFEGLQPALDSIESALALTDDKFRNRSI